MGCQHPYSLPTPSHGDLLRECYVLTSEPVGEYTLSTKSLGLEGPHGGESQLRKLACCQAKPYHPVNVPSLRLFTSGKPSEVTLPIWIFFQHVERQLLRWLRACALSEYTALSLTSLWKPWQVDIYQFQFLLQNMDNNGIFINENLWRLREMVHVKYLVLFLVHISYFINDFHYYCMNCK